MLEFGQPYCYFYHSKETTAAQRSHMQSDIISCRVIEDRDLQQRIENRDEKRSSSWIRRQLTDSVGRCPWNFPFLLEITDKSYELYAPTRNDREQLVNLLSTIAQMNKEGVKSEILTPFQWLRENEEKKQKRKAEEMMTQSARDKATQDEVQQLLFEQVHIWLRLNQGTMQVHRPVVKSYESEHMTMTADGARGSCCLIANQVASVAENTSDQKRSTYRLTKIQMHINARIQTFLVQKVGVSGISKYTFNEITAVESAENKISTIDFENSNVDPAFHHCFKIQVKNNPKKLVSCSSAEDKAHWIRCFELIIQMKNLGIDSGKVNMFSFEQFRQQRLKMAFEQSNMSTDNICFAQSVLPIEAEQSVSLKSSMRASTAIQRLNSLTLVEDEFQTLKTATFMNSYRYIEGYLLKEINGSNMLRYEARHLRYFRIVFATGKLNIKTCKDQNQMRSFFLRDLRSAKILADPDLNTDLGPRDGTSEPKTLGTFKETKQLFEINQAAELSNWPFTFSIDFVERRFDLAARTKAEMQEWMRIFELIVTLNKIGFNVSEKNPYKFEAQQNDMNSSTGQQMSQVTQPVAKQTLELSLNNTQLINSNRQVDYGIVNTNNNTVRSEIIHDGDPDIDDVNTASMAMNDDHGTQNQSIVINSINTSGENQHNLLRDHGFVQKMASNLRTMQIPSTFQRSNQNMKELAPNQERQGRFKTNNQTETEPYYKQNITVQNITINQMTMMQNYGQQQQQSTQAEAPRAASMEALGGVQVDLERQAEIKQRPISSLNVRTKKKKKKKKASSSSDYHSFYTADNNRESEGSNAYRQQDMSQSNLSDCNSSAMIGGYKEVDDVAYRTDVIQSLQDVTIDNSERNIRKPDIMAMHADNVGEYQDIESVTLQPGTRKKKLGNMVAMQNSLQRNQYSSAVIDLQHRNQTSASQNNFFSLEDQNSNNSRQTQPHLQSNVVNSIDQLTDFDNDLVLQPATHDFYNSIASNENQPAQTTSIDKFYGEYSDNAKRSGREGGAKTTHQELRASASHSVNHYDLRKSQNGDNNDKHISLSKVRLAGSQDRIDDIRLKNKIQAKNYRALNITDVSGVVTGLGGSRSDMIRQDSSKNVSMERIMQIANKKTAFDIITSPDQMDSVKHPVGDSAIPMLKKGKKKKVVRINRKLQGTPTMFETPAEVTHQATFDMHFAPNDDGVDKTMSAQYMMQDEGTKNVAMQSKRSFASAADKPETFVNKGKGESFMLSDWE